MHSLKKKDIQLYLWIQECNLNKDIGGEIYMSTVAGLKYSPKHTWVKGEGEFACVGVSDFAQEQLGEVLFVEMPEIDDELTKDESFGVIESSVDANAT